MKKIRFNLIICFLIFLITRNNLCAGTQNNSPYSLDFSKEWMFSITGVGFLTAALFLDGNKIPLDDNQIANLSQNDINAFDRLTVNNWSPSTAKTSDILVASQVASPVLLLLFDSTRKDFLKWGIIYSESVLMTLGMYNFAKAMVDRTRPFVYNPDADHSMKKQTDAIRSFYSGHTSMAFNSAVFYCTVFADYFPDSEWITETWICALTVSSTIGYLRYKAGKHFPTDILTGAVFGSLTGYLIPYFHRKKDQKYSLIPKIGKEVDISLNIKY